MATPTPGYNPRPVFIDYHNRPNRWSVITTHRRAGKTVALVNDLIYAAISPSNKPSPQYAYIGPTYTQAKRIAWAYLKQYSEPYWSRNPSESELKIYVDQSIIYCLGADNADSLRGIYLDGAVLDEYAMWKPSVFTQVIRPALSDRGGWATFASTPRGKNLFWDVVRQAQRNPTEWYSQLLPASTSGIIPPQELNDLRVHMDAEEFAQEYLCSFDSALKGAIYADEVNDLMATGRVHLPLDASPLYSPHLDTHFVFDLGFTDATVRIAYQLPPSSGQVHIVNVEATHGKDIFYHINSLQDFAHTSGSADAAGIGEIWLPHDARAKSLQTGKSIVEQFLEFNFTPRIVPNHKVHDGISATRRLFPRLVIDASPLDPLDPHGPTVTEDLLEALKAYRREWDEDHLMFKDQPLHDWSSDYADALRYLAITLRSDSPYSLLSSDNALDSLRDQRGKVWRPQIGYNLETLHTDRATQDEPRVMP